MSSQEAYALHEQWERNGYPNDVGGVYFDDSSMLGFLLVNPTPERIAELRSITGDNIIITPCKYSYNELQKVQGEITAEMKPNSKIYFVGIGFINKEFCVTVGVDESEFEHYSRELLRRYDDMVFVEIN